MLVEVVLGRKMRSLRCCVDENETDDENINVIEVKSSIFSESISDNEEQSRPW